jgi:hypothetical protein
MPFQHGVREPSTARRWIVAVCRTGHSRLSTRLSGSLAIPALHDGGQRAVRGLAIRDPHSRKSRVNDYRRGRLTNNRPQVDNLPHKRLDFHPSLERSAADGDRFSTLATRGSPAANSSAPFVGRNFQGVGATLSAATRLVQDPEYAAAMSPPLDTNCNSLYMYSRL